jgi:hypothetical protein
MSVSDIATEIFEELNSPTDISVLSIFSWLVGNIGKLNNICGITVALDDTGDEFDRDLSLEEKDIFKLLYLLYYYDRQIKQNLGAAAYDSSIVELREGNRFVRVVNKNEISKSYLQLRAQLQSDLWSLVNAYKTNMLTALSVDNVLEIPTLPYNPLHCGDYSRSYLY